MVSADEPFSELSGQEAALSILKGERLLIPDSCPHVVKNIIENCWHLVPNNRLEFLEIINLLQSHLYV